MHKNIERAFDEIDAAIFNSDAFFNREALAKLKLMLDRWSKQLPHLKELAQDD